MEVGFQTGHLLCDRLRVPTGTESQVRDPVVDEWTEQVVEVLADLSAPALHLRRETTPPSRIGQIFSWLGEGIEAAPPPSLHLDQPRLPEDPQVV